MGHAEAGVGLEGAVIHYHGTPITPRAQLLRMSGRHFCVSFAAPWDLLTCIDIGQSVMLDNGAFTAYTQGKKFNEDGFYKWIEPHLGHPQWAVEPDVIGGTVEDQRERAGRWPFPKALGVPVWHLGLPFDYLFELVDSWPKVALGSSGEYWDVGGPKWAGRMDETFNELAKRGPIPWLHGLRMLGMGGQRWPLASADSANVGRNWNSSGACCAEHMAERIDAVQCPVRWKEQPLQKNLDLCHE
jgi:hypothetical protein